MEDYLRAFYLFEEKDRNITITNIAKYLKISKPSVSEMVRKLRDKNYIKFKKYSDIKLTEKGRHISKKLTQKHRIIETFLTEKLGMQQDEVHDEAQKLEHAFSDKAIEKLNDFLGNPKRDPHGEVIP